jgi:hypothetical protein
MPRMQASEAKDFLVRQTAQQASLEGVSLSDLEKRMMHFTETEDASEDPAKLNDEFEAKFDTNAYESKISGLLHRAYARVKKEDPASARLWTDYVRFLRKGDHYILVLWDRSPAERPPHDSLKLLGFSLLTVIVLGALTILVISVADRYNIHWKTGPATHTQTPAWIQRLLFALLVGTYVFYLVQPWVSKKSGLTPGDLLRRFLRAAFGNRSER